MRYNSRFVSLYIAAFVSVAGAAFLQNTEILRIATIKPNITLAFLIVLSFMIPHFIGYTWISGFGVLALQFSPRFEWESVILFLIILILYIAQRKLPGNHFLNLLFLIAFSTALFYALIDIGFITLYPSMLFFEIVYNCIIGLLFYIIIQRFFAYD